MSTIDDASNEKDFDCVEFKHRAQALIYDKIKDMSHEEELAYWSRPVDGPLADWWRSLQADAQVVRESTPGLFEDDERP